MIMKTNASHKKAFTLIELLVVISIIALLLSMLMPSLQKAKGLAMRAVCTSNLHQIALASVAYSSVNNDFIPVPVSGYIVSMSSYGDQDVGEAWPNLVYGGNEGMLWEPGAAFPADERALARYIPAKGKTYKCPGDKKTRPGYDKGGRLSSW
jgi:prepilin-type N-terminal cleavage/methylation domain-containing protein